MERTLRVSRVFEAAQAEARALSDGSNQKDSHVNFNRSGHRASAGHEKRTKGFGKDRDDHDNGTACHRCGMSNHTADDCGARTAKCLYCKKVGHYARVCRKKNSSTGEIEIKGKNDSKQRKSEKPIRIVN